MLGETNPMASLPGTIRGDFALDIGRNICHGSDSVDAARREIGAGRHPVFPRITLVLGCSAVLPRDRSMKFIGPATESGGLVAGMWFTQDELCTWNSAAEQWL